jgi:hypothetical protein
MQFLMLLESISKVITADNIDSVVTLVEKLASLAESIYTPPAVTPPTTPPSA